MVIETPWLALDGGRRHRFEPEQELRAGEDGLERCRHTRLEVTIGTSAAVERHQTIKVSGRHRPPEGLGGEVAHNARGARSLLRWRRGTACEDLPPARGIRYAGDLRGTDNRHVFQVRQCGQSVRHANLRVGQGVIDRGNKVIDRALEPLQERGRDAMRPGADVNGRCADNQSAGHVGEPWIDIKQRHAIAVDRHLNLLIQIGPPEQEAASVTVQFYAYCVVAIGRKGMDDRYASARAQWRPWHLFHLRLRLRHPIEGLGRFGLRVTQSERGDASRRPQIRLHQRRRKHLRIGHVVKPCADGVGGQQCRHIDVDLQQVADRAGILSAIEALEHTTTGTVDRYRRVDASLKGLGQSRDSGRIGTTCPGRWHHAGAKLANHLFGEVGVLGGGRRIVTGQRQAAGLGAVIVTARTVLADGLVLTCRGRRRRTTRHWTKARGRARLSGRL